MGITKRQLDMIERNRRQFVPVSQTRRKRKVSNPDWDRTTCIAHPLDDDILKAMKGGKVKHEEVLFDLFDPNIDGENATYNIQWTDSNIESVHFGMLQRCLEILRYAKPDNNLFQEEVEWLASEQFEQICFSMGCDPNVIRVAIPRIMERYDKPLVGEAARIINAFKRLHEKFSFNETQVERIACFNK
ncbi:hypothetical protein K0504_09550 [Neiella marina]|uniref:Uncharacterized protein n=1 Tax=Neiella holothuriorum TaxID=2870530 RepID=A0ABS7EG89_9GAMM|nr:hypothetical protein [Neiella holothuriorum]MBW8191280.1 hypothetical protein [Neiella holothuriorum]